MDVSAVWPFPLSLRSKLAAAGYGTLASLHNVSPSALARDIQVSREEALIILKSLRATADASPTPASKSCSLLGGAKTAWDLLCLEKERRRISTSCAELDSLLGGGICLQEVTEICGAPGIGKTQVGMQLAINVQVPKEADGVGGTAVYIDTEGSFMVERAVQIGQARVAELCGFNGAGFKSEEPLKLEGFLSNIYYFRICDATEQIAVVNHLESFLSEHKEVKLVVIDSITFHFRHGFEDMPLRTRLLSSMGQKLMHLAESFEVAVVLMNQVTTKFSGGSSKLVPALGESWSHACTNRLILYWENSQRSAFMFKSPSLPSLTAHFSVTPEGIRGLDSNKRQRSS